MLQDHSRRTRGQKACEICHDDGFTVESIHACRGCEAEVCERHFEDSLCSNCQGALDSERERQDDIPR